VAGVGAGLIAKKFFGRAHPLEALLNGSALRALGDLLISFIFFFISTHIHFLNRKNVYEQNLPQFIARAKRGDFYSYSIKTK
jgi:hypothetical protein